MQKFTYLFIVLFSLMSTSIFAQEIYAPGSHHNSYFQTCYRNFTDTGGPWGNYSNNQDYFVTICPDQTGKVTTANFTGFQLESNYDYLYIYDEYRTSAVQSWNRPSESDKIGTYTGSNSPGYIASSKGCLTFRFVSDGSRVYSGWTARIGCADSYCSNVVDINCNSDYWGSTNYARNNMERYSCSESAAYTFRGKDVVHRFTTHETSDIKVILSNLYSDLDVFLMNSCDPRTCLKSSINGGNNNDVINYLNAPPGEYFVVVDAVYAGSVSSYKLRVNCTQIINYGCDNAIVYENFNNYYNGNVSDQSYRWAKFSNNFRDGRVTSQKYNSPHKSLEMNYSRYDEQSVTLKLGNKSWGKYRLNWKMYINWGKGAHFSLMESQDWFSYPAAYERAVHRHETSLQGRWVDVKLFVDLDNNQLKLYYDDNFIATKYYDKNLGGLNFYSLPGYHDQHGQWVWLDSSFFLDDICFQQIYWFPLDDEEDTMALNSDEEEITTFVTERGDSDTKMTLDTNTAPTNMDATVQTLSTAAMNIFPNPASDQATIRMELAQEETVTLQVFNQLGQMVQNIPLGKTDRIDTALNISDLSVGIYLIRITGEATQVTKQLVVKR